MHKLAWVPAGTPVPHSHAPLFAVEPTSDGSMRLVAGVPDGDARILLQLAQLLPPPFFVLYVLHTPRSEGKAGRYQSPAIELDDLRAFVTRYAAFFAGDARFDVWVHSPGADGTIVWDRHNILYAYGPLESFRQALTSMGFSEGRPVVPVPHVHHYRAEFDADARALLTERPWDYSPLHPEDVQS